MYKLTFQVNPFWSPMKVNVWVIFKSGSVANLWNMNNSYCITTVVFQVYARIIIIIIIHWSLLLLSLLYKCTVIHTALANLQLIRRGITNDSEPVGPSRCLNHVLPGPLFDRSRELGLLNCDRLPAPTFLRLLLPLVWNVKFYFLQLSLMHFDKCMC